MVIPNHIINANQGTKRKLAQCIQKPRNNQANDAVEVCNKYAMMAIAVVKEEEGGGGYGLF